MTMQIAANVSFDTDSLEAGRKAARAALSGMKSSAAPGLALVFASPVHDLKAVLQGVRAVLPASTLIAGGFSEARFWEEQGPLAGVSVSLAASDDYSFAVASSAWVKQEAMGAFRQMKTGLSSFLAAPGIGSYLTIMDCQVESRDVCLAAVQTFRSDIHLAGGEMNPFSKTSGVIANDIVLPGGVAVVAVKGPRPFFSGVFPLHKALRGPITAPKSEVDDYSPLAIPQRNFPRPRLAAA